MAVLVVNAGSSSTKLRVLDDTDTVAADVDMGPPDPAVADAAVRLASAEDVSASVHRIVHGGSDFRHAVLVDDRVDDELKALGALAPLHNPPALSIVDALRRAVPEKPLVACFDTAFFAELPPASATYALPRRWREDLGVRRFGFHGLSHARAWRRGASLAGVRPGDARVVTAHLGAGASLAAVHGGQPVDTTMGFTPLDGLVMATRAGSLDPGVLLHVLRHGGVDAEGLDDVLEHGCGLRALAGTPDLRAVLERAASGDDDARLARDVYLHRLVQGVAAMAATLGGLDVLVFTGGAGEASSELRRRVSERLGFLGVGPLADGPGDGDRLLSGPDAPVAVCVVATREDLQMAAEARRVLAEQPLA